MGSAIDKTADILFEFLRDAIYDPANAILDTTALPEAFKQLGEGLKYYVHCVNQGRELARALSKGDLSAPQPPPDNEIAAPLKALNSSLKHMSWQTQQVAKGDYQQHVDFLGEFADAFNTMTRQLEQRQAALLAEIDAGRRKTQALEQSNSLLEEITENSPQWIIVLNRPGGHKLFANRVAENVLGDQGEFSGVLMNWLAQQAADKQNAAEQNTLEVGMETDGGTRYLSVTSYPISWRRKNALAFVIRDISADKMHMRQLEHRAYEDSLTKTYNRYYGMRKLSEWVAQKLHFVLCFVDIDNLKYVNDTFGHPEGDRYIIDAAGAMRDYGDDLVLSRLGGDEFLLLVPGADYATAQLRMDQLRRQLMQMPPSGSHSYLRSISYGLVEVDEDNTLFSSELLSIADERMYDFKRAHKMQRQTLLAE